MSETTCGTCDVCGRPQTRSLYQQGCAAGGAYLDCESDEKAYASLDCLHSAALARAEKAEAEAVRYRHEAQAASEMTVGALLDGIPDAHRALRAERDEALARVAVLEAFVRAWDVCEDSEDWSQIMDAARKVVGEVPGE